MSQIDEFLSSAELPPSRNRNSPGRRIALIATAAVLVLAFIAFVGFARQLGRVDTEVGGAGTGAVTVVVGDGDSLREIAAKLKDSGVISTIDGFLAAAEGDKRSAGLRPGVYTLKEGMTGSGALALMLDPSSFKSTTLVIPEGLTTAQVVGATSRTTGISADDLNAVLGDAATLSRLGLPDWAGGRPEGFLFPATYDVPIGANAEQVVGLMIRRFNQAAESVRLEARAERLGLSAYDIVTVASLAQAEVVPDDFELVTRVIYNRLDQGMKLQLDSTVNFALGKREILLTDEELQTQSPYNTYLNTGLPPTPINSPGEAALKAALDPEKGPWLYFVATDPERGETEFTADYDQFLRWKQEFRDKVTKRR